MVINRKNRQCYDAEGNLICGLEEHQHSELCRSPQISLLADLPGEFIDGGTITGTEVTWVITEDDSGERTLTIGGQGAIPDYTNANDTPWASYAASAPGVRLVVEDGITRIGNYSFMNRYLSSVEIGSGVTSIGNRAFSYARTLSSLTIPGNVKSIETYALSYISSLQEFSLEEGVETLGTNVFTGSSMRALHLPASLRECGALGNMGSLESVSVAENGLFQTVDGVLFKKRTDDTWELLVYPARRTGGVYRIPDTIDGALVTVIQAQAFGQSVYLKELTTPAGITTIRGYSFQQSSIEKVVIEGNTLSGDNSRYAFIDMTQLREIDFSRLEGAIPGQFLMNGSSLTAVHIPSGATFCGNDAFRECTALELVEYDARDMTWNTTYNPMGTAAYPRYRLQIGPNVDALNSVFYQMSERADRITFQGPNQITIAEGALADAPAPFTNLSGTIYVDAQGVIYTYDGTAGTASLFYCPPDAVSVTVPGTITPEEGVSCQVVGVGRHVLEYAEHLTSVTFEKPEQVRTLEAYAFADCPTLTQVNGETTYEAAAASFPNAEIGYRAFDNTGLDGASGSGNFEKDMDGAKSLEITADGAPSMTVSVASSGDTMEWQPKEGGEEGTGGYRLLTGDTMPITASVGNTAGTNTHVYRVYYQLTDESGSLNLEVGAEYTFDGQKAVCYATEDPNTVYLEFIPDTGATVSIPATVSYPSPGTFGGGLTVWGVILTEEEAERQGGMLIESTSGTIEAFWTTKAEPFQITKTYTGAGTLNIVGDGEGGARPSANLSWQIQLTHGTQTNPSMGKDYARSVDYSGLAPVPLSGMRRRIL